MAGFTKLPITIIKTGNDDINATKNVFEILTWNPSYIVNITAYSDIYIYICIYTTVQKIHEQRQHEQR